MALDGAGELADELAYLLLVVERDTKDARRLVSGLTDQVRQRISGLPSRFSSKLPAAARRRQAHTVHGSTPNRRRTSASDPSTTTTFRRKSAEQQPIPPRITRQVKA
ncbi:MAG: hypothetical protein AAF663_01380 [Planctomycetota bacterium]